MIIDKQKVDIGDLLVWYCSPEIKVIAVVREFDDNYPYGNIKYATSQNFSKSNYILAFILWDKVIKCLAR